MVVQQHRVPWGIYISVRQILIGTSCNILFLPSLIRLQGDKSGIVRTVAGKQGNCDINVSKERECFQER